LTGRGNDAGRVLGAAVALIGLVALAGCTSSGGASPSSAPTTAASGTPSSAPSSAPNLSSPSSTAPTSTTPAFPTSRKPPPALPACTSSNLKIAALRGSASAGQEFALLTFTNTGAATCTMFGFPGVSLRLGSAMVGKAAERSAKKPTTVSLKRGARAESVISDFSSCQAPVSEKVRVYAPNQVAFVDLPLALRACRVIVEPVTHS
jgi:hypothetical protein